MTQAQASVRDRAKPASLRPSVAVRWFFPIAAIVIAAFAFIGFSQFYLHGGAYPDRPITPPIKWIIIAHGVSMSAWLALLIMQPTLIAARNYKLHMKIGKIGACLAGLILVLGLWVAIRSAQVTPADAIFWGLTPKQFLAVSSGAIVVFATFVALGVTFRKTPHLHRTMMILGTLFAMAAAFDRIAPIRDTYVNTFWAGLFGPYLPALVLGAVFVAIRSILGKKFDAVFAIGVIVLALLAALQMKFATTGAWDSIASVFVK